MPIPGYKELFTDVLDALPDGDFRERREVVEEVINKMGLTTDERAEKLKSGYSRAGDRVHWAITYLRYAEAVKVPEKGSLQITELGAALLEANPDGVTLAVLEATQGLQAWYQRGIEKAKNKSGQTVAATGSKSGDDQTPSEGLESSIKALNDEVAANVLSRLQQNTPLFMERSVLKVLHRLGYGTDESDLQHVGGPYDGGIDGIINQDKLGLDRIYVQSKRYQDGSGISGNDIRAFAGAMDGSGVNKGVFITSSHFTPQALEAARQSPKQIILLDGETLANLMVEYRIGVTEVQTYTVFALDENFFAED